MNVKKSLMRKLGPLPAWGWLILVAGVIYYYRKMRGTSSTVSGTGTGSVAPAPADPQPTTTLQPGESVYNPNTGSLTTAPGGSNDMVNRDPTLTDAMNSLASAIANGMPPTQTNPGGDVLPGADPGVFVPGIAPGVKNKPSHPKGNRLPRVLWKGSQKRTVKGKGQAAAKGKTSKHVKAGAKTVTRSSTTHRTTSGGRTGKRGVLTEPATLRPTSHPRSTKATKLPTSARTSQRTKTPAVTTVVQQRRIAATQPPPQRASAVPSARPSAPPPRTQRAPAKAPARPAGRRRK